MASLENLLSHEYVRVLDLAIALCGSPDSSFCSGFPFAAGAIGLANQSIKAVEARIFDEGKKRGWVFFGVLKGKVFPVTTAANIPLFVRCADVRHWLEEPAKPAILPITEPQTKNDMFLVMLAAIKEHEAETGSTPDESQLWERLKRHPPEGHGVAWAESKKALNVSGTLIDRQAFSKRYRRYYRH